MPEKKPQNHADYISLFPDEVQAMMLEVSAAIKTVVPDAEETIKYDMPCFTVNGENIAYFGGFKHHIGFYPAPTGIPEFETDLSAYKTGRGSVQLPINKPMPIDLVKRMVEYRLKKVAG